MTAYDFDSNQLQELVAQCLGQIEDGDTQAVDEACRLHPDLADRLRERLSKLASIGLLSVGSSDETFPERLGEFRLVRRLGGGGMGVVYLAEQESLGREVALKLIRPDYLYFPGARERFRREVETVAQLHHPGIVPIYTVGEEERTPYFAMEWVRGCTLAEVLRDLANRNPSELAGEDLARAVVRCTPDTGPDDDALASAGSLFQGTWPETCFRVIQSVADALQHVHEHGVLHRDLKPSNIMITPMGRVMLVDFGLASGHTGGSLTRTGTELGSAAYVPPEQLDGDTAKLDSRADIYSLGVTLYELLTLRQPYRGAPDVMRQQILVGQPKPVRPQNASVSWEMETVCLTAFDRDRSRRYASTRDLGRDLGNALQARPLLARRPGPWLRARRYLQRHPTLGATAVVAFTLLTAAAFAFAVFQHNAKARVDQQREHAWENLVDARSAVDRMLKRVSEGVLSQTPYMEEVRRSLLEDALAFYRGFLARHGDSPELRFEAGTDVAVPGTHSSSAR